MVGKLLEKIPQDKISIRRRTGKLGTESSALCMADCVLLV